MDELRRLCDFCKCSIESGFSWHLKLTYGAYGGFGAKEICVDCAVNSYKMGVDKIRFFQELIDFRKEEGFRRSIWDTTVWSKKQVGAFATRLKKKGIPIKDYGVEIYRVNVKGGSWNDTKPVFLHQLLGRDDVVVDVGNDVVDEEIYGELEKNHDSFLSLIGADIKKKKKGGD